MAEQPTTKFDRMLALFGLARRRPDQGSDINSALSWIEYLRTGLDPFSGYAQISQDRIVKYNEYDMMDQYGDIAVALDIYGEEVSQPDPEEEKVIWVTSKNKELAASANEMLQQIRAEDKVWAIGRNLGKYGDVFEYLLTNQTGIYNLQFIHPSRVNRVQTDKLLGFQCDDLARLIHSTIPGGPGGVPGGGGSIGQFFQPWDFVHFRIEADDRETIYGRSMIEAVRKCYSADTEILTRERGWVLFKDLKEGEEVATRNPNTKEFEWQVPVEIVKQPYRGKMIRFQGQSVDLLVTPNHEMLLSELPDRVQKYNTCAEGEVVVDAENLVGLPKSAQYPRIPVLNVRIPTTSKWTGVAVQEKVFESQLAEIVNAGSVHRARPVRMDGNDYCAFMGMYLAEGSLTRGKYDAGLEIGQLPTSKGYGPYNTLISRVLREPAKHYGKSFHISRTVLYGHFSQFGKAKDKYIPDDVMNSTPRQLRLFWDYFVLGDGCKIELKDGERILISTVSKRLADQLQEIAQKLGMWATITERVQSKRWVVDHWQEGGGKIYVVTTRQLKDVGISSITEEDYDGNIYCVGVPPNGTVFVRRQGLKTAAPVWCKNTWKELQILETMAAVFRITKSVERNVIFVDVGDASPQEAKKWVERWRRHFRKDEFIDPQTGDFRIDLRGISPMEDIIIPIRTGSATKIEKLAPSPDIGAVEDLEYFRSKLRTALGIPKEYFDQQNDNPGWNAKEALIMKDMRFSRKIARIRRALITGFTRMVAIHLTLMDESWEPGEFEVQMAPVNQIAERLGEERWLRIIELLNGSLPLAQIAQLDQKLWNEIFLQKIMELPQEVIEALTRVTSPLPGVTVAMAQAGIAAPPTGGMGAGRSGTPAASGGAEMSAGGMMGGFEEKLDTTAILMEARKAMAALKNGHRKDDEELQRQIWKEVESKNTLVEERADLEQYKYWPHMNTEEFEIDRFREFQYSPAEIQAHKDWVRNQQADRNSRKEGR